MATTVTVNVHLDDESTFEMYPASGGRHGIKFCGGGLIVFGTMPKLVELANAILAHAQDVDVTSKENQG